MHRDRTPRPRPEWANIIARRRNELGKSQEVLADEIGVSQTWVSRVERGLIEPTSSAAATFHAFLFAMKWSATDFEKETGLELPTMMRAAFGAAIPTDAVERRSIPVYDLVSAGNGADGGSSVAYVDIPESWHGTYAGYIVDGDSMAPRIPSGSTIIVRQQDYASPRNIVVCWIDGHGMVVKFLDRIESGAYVLTSFNPAYPPIWAREARIFGVVREVRMPIDIINGNH